jgi:uracil-DNA glycosylase
MEKSLIQEIKDCRICEAHLPLGPRPVFSIHPSAKVIIIGQAPGTKVHASGIPWDDQSGRRLRSWLNVSDQVFYDSSKFAIVPMGFCYPGKGKGGDLPPRPECAPQWHTPLLDMMPGMELYLLIGQYAQRYYLGKSRKKTLTETVSNYEEYLPKYLPLPHPSPRNLRWFRRNPWFEEAILPILRKRVHQLIH